MDVPGATIIVAGLTVAGTLLNTYLAARLHKEVKTGNGIKAGEAIYALYQHTQKPAHEAHPEP